VDVRIGTSGWSYPSWRPGFYPDGTKPAEFLAFYSTRFDTVELNSTGYRLPAAEQFDRWAAAVPDTFRFAPKLGLAQPGRLRQLVDRASGLGPRLGPVRIVVESARDDGLVERLLSAAGGDVLLAFDFRHPTWAGIEGVVAVNDPAASPFRYLRLREPPYTDADLQRLASAVEPPAYVFFRHEDAPTAPAYAERLLELIGAGRPPA
jgi:uncharacterized protein YecE (DUF72 family)